MPRRRKSYLLTETAARDFKAARAWSLSRWGQRQTQTYFRKLHDAAEYVAANQSAVPSREDLTDSTDIGVYPVGEHYVVYAPIDKKRIAIVALVRQTRDVPTILRENGFLIHRALAAALKHG